MVSKAPLFFKLHGAGAWDVPKALDDCRCRVFKTAVRTALHWPIEVAACKEAWSQAVPAMLGHSAMLGHGAIVQSIDDPLQAAVSPFPGNTCQNATRVPEQLDGDLRLAFAISHADLPRADSLRQLVSQVGAAEGWAFRRWLRMPQSGSTLAMLQHQTAPQEAMFTTTTEQRSTPLLGCLYKDSLNQLK